LYGPFVSVTLREAGLDDREQLRRLLADYLYEFDGRTEPYPYFDAYWTEPDRLPFLIVADGEAVGICLVRTREDGGWSIAEFSVVPARRRAGVGRQAVEELAVRARAAGAAHLEAKVHPGNLQALPFWLAAGFREVGRDGAVVTRRELHGEA
jgi:ribosomal protein S18 acetylase RimI-like enzyme